MLFRPLLFVSPLCACPIRKFLLATSEKREWKSGFKSSLFSVFVPPSSDKRKKAETNYLHSHLSD